MKLKSRIISLSLSVAASIFLVIVGCGGGGGGGGSAPPLPSSADVSLTKTVSNSAPDVNDDVVFTLTVSNAGPASATGVIVNDQLPSGFTYVTDSSGGAYNPVTGVWSVGTVAVGANQVLTITATVNGTGNFTNLAQVDATNDGTPNNNSAGVAAPPPSINVSLNQIQTDCNTNEVKAFVTVVDQLGVSVTTLIKDDFTVTENQRVLLANEFDVEFVNTIPLSVSIVLDYSTSIFDSGIKADMETAASAFVDELSAGDRAQIIKFNKTWQVIQSFTSDKAALKAAIQATFAPEAVTELYRAILLGIDGAASEPADNRKAVVFFTDGRNNPEPSLNPPTVDDVLDAANADSIPIFPVVLGADFRPEDIDELTRLAQESGGIFYQSIQISDLTDIYQQLADALIINQFVFTYTSPLTGGNTATLTIRAVDPNGLTDSDTKQFTTCP